MTKKEKSTQKAEQTNWVIISNSDSQTGSASSVIFSWSNRANEGTVAQFIS